MKILIFKIIGFVSLFCVFLFVIGYSNRHFSNFKIEKNKHLLVLGHSHSECAYNDSLIDGLVNYSHSGESYFYTFFKTKLLLDQNPSIDHVFIEFSNNQIENDMDEWIWGNDVLSYRLPKYGSFMDLESFELLLKNNPEGIKHNLSLWYRNNLKNMVTGFQSAKDIGGYLYLERNKTDSLLACQSNQKTSLNRPIKVSTINLEYLQKTIKYCKQKKVKIFLIRSPMHQRFEGYDNEMVFQEILKNKFSNIEFLDFSKVPFPNAQFGDLQHLNHKGSKVFSNWFAKAIKNGMLNEIEKQVYIDKEIEKRMRIEKTGRYKL